MNKEAMAHTQVDGLSESAPALSRKLRFPSSFHLTNGLESSDR